MEHREKNTIDAINTLKDSYPYAASLLIYVIIERQLKEYILKHRKDRLHSKSVCLFNNKTVQLAEYDNETDEVFVHEVICKATLGQIEKTMSISQNLPSKDRNELIHSNLYISGEKDLPTQDRQVKNLQRLKTAKSHLMKIFNDFSDNSIVDEGGELTISGT